MIPVFTFAVLFTILFALYQKWQFAHAKHGYYSVLPEAIVASQRWHLYGALMRFSCVAYSLVSIWLPPTWQDVVLSAAVCAPLWSILINVLALKKKWYYSGVSTSPKYEWDDLGHVKWLVYSLGIIASVSLKLFT